MKESDETRWEICRYDLDYVSIILMSGGANDELIDEIMNKK